MRFLLLLVAAIVAIFAGVAALQLSAPPADKGAPAQSGRTPSDANVLTVDVLVARAAIPAGTEITAAMVDKQPWPENLVLTGFISGAGSESTVIGKVTRSAFQAREPLLATKLAAPDDAGFLAASLPTGMRAITIAIDAITGVAGFVFAGDRVDILFTHSIPDGSSKVSTYQPAIQGITLGGLNNLSGGSMGGASVAEVLAVNVPVLAVNIREESGSMLPTPDALLGSIAGGGSTTAPSSLTLQVTDKQAEQIRLAERVGSLSVTLRSVSDRGDTTLPAPALVSGLTQVPAGSAPTTTTSDDVKIVRGGSTSAPAASGMPNMFNMLGAR